MEEGMRVETFGYDGGRIHSRCMETRLIQRTDREFDERLRGWHLTTGEPESSFYRITQGNDDVTVHRHVNEWR